MTCNGFLSFPCASDALRCKICGELIAKLGDTLLREIDEKLLRTRPSPIHA